MTTAKRSALKKESLRDQVILLFHVFAVVDMGKACSAPAKGDMSVVHAFATLLPIRGGTQAIMARPAKGMRVLAPGEVATAGNCSDQTRPLPGE